MEKCIERIPTWSLDYIINGDATALNGDEIKMIDNLFHKQHIELVCSVEYGKEAGAQPYFLHSLFSEFLLKSRTVW